MQNTKKIAIFALSTLVLAGGAYMFRDSAIFDGLSSSVLNQSFVCTESGLRSESASYRQTQIRYKKALVIQKNLESEIAQMIATMSGEVQKKQDALKILKRQITIYARFIKKYDTCKREVHLQPILSPGIMSGEAKIIPSLPNAYQELVGLEIASPHNLDTFMNTLQFHVRMTPAQSLTIDQWLLTSDASAPSPCQSSQSGDTIILDCDMLGGGIPTSIPSTTKNTYRLGAHIISVDQTVEGSIEIAVSGMTFNDGRAGFENKTTPSILRYGTLPVAPKVLQPEIIIPIVETTMISPVTEVVVETPLVPDSGSVSSDEVPAQSETIPVVISPVLDTPVADTLPPVTETSTPPADEASTLPPANELSSGTEMPPVSPEILPTPEANIPTTDAIVN